MRVCVNVSGNAATRHSISMRSSARSEVKTSKLNYSNKWPDSRTIEMGTRYIEFKNDTRTNTYTRVRYLSRFYIHIYNV